MVTIAGSPRRPDGDGRREGRTPDALTRRIALPMRGASCAVAREFVRTTLWRAGWSGDVEAAVLLASELVANALGHARSPCSLTVRLEGPLLRIEAADADPGPPVVERTVQESPRGRGVALVEALASAWGSSAGPEAGTTIWFEMPSRAA